MAGNNEKGGKCASAAGWWRRLLAREWVTKAGSHVSLMILLVVYTVLGAKIFQALEYDAEVTVQEEAKVLLLEARQQFLNRVLSLEEEQRHAEYKGDTTVPLLLDGEVVTGETDDDLPARVSWWLQQYEKAAEASQGSGMSLVAQELQPRWNYPQSVFFSATVLTTIGYGNIAPATVSGRIFCIVFALVGIPLTLTVLANLGQPLVNLLPVATIEKLLPDKANSLNTSAQGPVILRGRLKTAVTVAATLSLLVTFIALGGLLFMWLDDRTFMEAFYFCFITTTTIGFGDIVPASTETVSMLCCLLYILVGLALTTTVIELVQRQYASSWAEMKQLTARLHALSGPLASAMRKLAESGKGEVEVDAALVRELRDINFALEEVQRRESTSNSPAAFDPEPWDTLLNTALSRKRLKLVIYESNV